MNEVFWQGACRNNNDIAKLNSTLLGLIEMPHLEDNKGFYDFIGVKAHVWSISGLIRRRYIAE